MKTEEKKDNKKTDVGEKEDKVVKKSSYFKKKKVKKIF